MRMRCRYPRLAAAACRVYGLTIWLYPAEFRRAFGRELAVTFRTRVEDVLETGGIGDWLAFVAHIALDALTTYSMLVTRSGAQGAVSLLGLSEGEVAHGCLDRATLDIQLMFASAGVALAFAGWFAFLVILPKHVC
jgi:hypothetical protein